MTRGKTELIVMNSLSVLAQDLSKFANDACMYMSQNFGFISLPDTYTTGSSIMPHKKNPDVFELLRAKLNQIKAAPVQLQMLMTNLSSGYFRDLQLTKEILFPNLSLLKDCLEVLINVVPHIKPNENCINDKKYELIFSVENVNTKVQQGTAFRDAYKEVALEIETGSFEANKDIQHQHIGSIGNPAFDEIEAKYKSIRNQFPFKEIETQLEKLITI